MSTENFDKEIARTVDALAMTMSAMRTHGAVYMDGSHNPLPSERIAAKQFVYDMVTAGWMPPFSDEL